jgi:tyrosine-specific transport protein
MNKLLSSVFLISGTAMGAGLVALPLASANIVILMSSIIVLFSFFIAYQTSSMTNRLIEKSGSYCSIVELSKRFAGQPAMYVTIASFYILSLSLLSVYFVGTSSIIDYFLDLKDSASLFLCSVLFLFALKSRAFNKVNSVLFIVLLASIGLVIFSTFNAKQALVIQNGAFTCKDIFYFVPIIFTSFGVQNVCPYVCEILEMDREKIKRAFFIGTLIPAVVYSLWIYTTLQSVYSIDVVFFERILNHQVDVGELVGRLCESARSEFVNIFFKILSLFAIITSAAGIGIGLVCSLKERVKSKISTVIPLIIVVIPALVTLLIPNAFMKALSFGGAIATIFVIFTPFYLTLRENKDEAISIKNLICVAFGVIVVLSEVLR